MRVDPDCLFCKIVAGSIPAQKVYEDDTCLAFRDIQPEAPSHVLLIPREHICRVDQVDEADELLLGHLMHVAGKVAAQEGCEDFRIVVNAGPSAGQTVFHLHLHILGGRAFGWPPG